MSKLVFNDVPGNWHTNDFTSVSLTSVSFETGRVKAYIFFGHANIDFDGSPTAYGPTGPRNQAAAIPAVDPPPDDCLGNGGNATDGYFGVVAMGPNDPLVRDGTALIDQDAPQFLGKFPLVQQARNHDPKPGYYVSKSSHRHGPIHLQNSYIDSSKVSYGALDAKLLQLGVGFGDFGLAIRHDRDLQSGFYFVDGGGAKYALGECSHKVALDLGFTKLSGKPCSWDNNYPVSFIVFPGSGFMHYDANAGAEIGFGIQELNDTTIEKALRPPLAELSRADNARDLARLMAFNEASPPNAPSGLPQLVQHLRRGGATPSSFVLLMIGLSRFGFWPFPQVPKEKQDPFNRPNRVARPQMF